MPLFPAWSWEPHVSNVGLLPFHSMSATRSLPCILGSAVILFPQLVGKEVHPKPFLFFSFPGCIKVCCSSLPRHPHFSHSTQNWINLSFSVPQYPVCISQGQSEEVWLPCLTAPASVLWIKQGLEHSPITFFFLLPPATNFQTGTLTATSFLLIFFSSICPCVHFAGTFNVVSGLVAVFVHWVGNFLLSYSSISSCNLHGNLPQVSLMLSFLSDFLNNFLISRLARYFIVSRIPQRS